MKALRPPTQRDLLRRYKAHLRGWLLLRNVGSPTHAALVSRGLCTPWGELTKAGVIHAEAVRPPITIITRKT